ncbi:addiction module protein [Aurantibacillus circumpalustris]|uniref:addiction module protein n=1 Tax=Aurantibacillus circumpalustris TaxID=3036359 RepID=UPI00295C16F5|nr:addiction module protein [Aurantibacillus circumpalustris]
MKAIELLFDQEEETFELTSEQKKELDKQLAEVESGKAKFYNMDEVKKMVRKSLRKK